jgi:hypothetical protein
VCVCVCVRERERESFLPINQRVNANILPKLCIKYLLSLLDKTNSVGVENIYISNMYFPYSVLALG